MRLYTRPNSPFWWFDVTINAARLRGSTKCTAKAEARAYVAALITQAGTVRRVDDNWRLRDVTGAYWHDVGQHARSEGNIFHYLSALNDIIGRDTPVTDITTATLLDYRVRRRRYSKRGCSAVTVNRDLATLRAAFNHARFAHGRAVPDIAWARVMVRENPWRTRYATADEFARLVDRAHPALRPMLVMAVTTGLRRANILSLDWRQVDLDGAVITLPRTKSGRAHVVHINPVLRAALSKHAPDQAQRSGRVFDAVNFRKRWDKLRHDADVRDLRWHDLRHTFGTWARMAGADLQTLMAALGHSDVKMTMRYSNAAPGGDAGAFDRVGQLMMGRVAGEETTAASQRKAGGRK